MHRYFVLAGFSLLGILFFLIVLIYRRKGIRFMGIPSIEKFYFITGKITLFIPWALFLFKAISQKSGYIIVPSALSWIAVVLLWIGSFILLLGLYTLKESLKIGLPLEPTILKTKNIYRISRNPIYTGAFLISFGSCLYFPDLINISFTLYGIYLHHRIILSEEKFLQVRFQDQWTQYQLKVRRYI